MGGMVVRNIPDDVLERFKEKAKRERKSAEQMARELFIEAANLDNGAVWEVFDQIRESTMGKVVLDSTVLIRADRDRNHETQ